MAADEQTSSMRTMQRCYANSSVIARLSTVDKKLTVIPCDGDGDDEIVVVDRSLVRCTVTVGDGDQLTVAVGSTGTLTVAVGRSGRHVGLTAVGGKGVAVGCGGHTPCFGSRRPRRRLLVTYQPTTGRATACLILPSPLAFSSISSDAINSARTFPQPTSHSTSRPG